MEEKTCKYCKKKIDKNAIICPYCNQQVGIPKWRLFVGIPLIIIVLIITGIFIVEAITYFSEVSSTTDYKDISEYQPLDIQQLQTAYEENEMNAVDKYSGNYYYFTGEIEDIEDNILDDEITFMYHSSNNAKQMEVLASFTNKYEKLLNLKVGDTITVYCKFYDRIIDNYAGITSTYSFKSCQIF